MSPGPPFEARELSRRRFLSVAGAAVAASTLPRFADPLAAFGATSWPKATLTARDAVRVDQRQFMPASQFRSWNAALDKLGPANQRGLRATGSRAHEGYVDDLYDDLKRAGVDDLHLESLPMRRWTTDSWSLDFLDGPAAGAVRTASYIPYSGQTPVGGVTGALVFVEAGATPAPGSLAGKIAVFDVPLTTVTIGFFAQQEYPGSRYDPRRELDPAAPYKRPYLNSVVPVLERLQAAGAAGVVGILDYPAAGADGSYFPYDGEVRTVPGVYVDRATGAALRERARAGDTQARLRLPAQVKTVKTRNLIGFIPGRSRELVTLHCHTDGSNAIEDNGPAAIVAMSQYLTRLPRTALPRTIMILLTTGHFAGGNGAQAFRSRHRDDLVKRTNAALTIEHLGLREWDEVAAGRMGPTGRFEPGSIFAPNSKALVDISATALEQAKTGPGSVLRPLNAKASGTPHDAAWPGEGQYLFANGGMQTANYITGPTYLLNWGITTTDKVDFNAVRAESIAFTEMILRLGRTSRAALRAKDAR